MLLLNLEVLVNYLNKIYLILAILTAYACLCLTNKHYLILAPFLLLFIYHIQNERKE